MRALITTPCRPEGMRKKMRKLLDVNPFVRINLRIVSDEMPTIETNRNAILRRLGQEGWTLARHGGSHDLYAKPGADVLISVPRHKTLSPGTARSIAKSAGWYDPPR